MLLAYVDESVDNAYFINTLLIREHEVIPLSLQLRSLRDRVARQYGLNPEVEFHGYELFNGEGDWRPIKRDYDAIKSIYIGFLEIVFRFEVRIFIKGIEIEPFRMRYGDAIRDIHNAALLWNLEAVQEKATTFNELVLVVSDEVNENEIHFRANLRHHQINPTFGWNPVVLDRIVDTIHFAPSRESFLLQAIDMLAYVNIRARTEVKNVALKDFQNLIMSLFRNPKYLKYYHVWHPPI